MDAAHRTVLLGSRHIVRKNHWLDLLPQWQVMQIHLNYCLRLMLSRGRDRSRVVAMVVQLEVVSCMPLYQLRTISSALKLE